jgi:hypothetical protein
MMPSGVYSAELAEVPRVTVESAQAGRGEMAEWLNAAVLKR